MSEHRWRVGMLGEDGDVDPSWIGGPVTLGLWETESPPLFDVYKAVDALPIPLKIITDRMVVAVPQRTHVVNDTAAGVIYEVTIDYDENDDPYLTSCAAYATKPGRSVETIPARRLAQHAARHFAEEDEEDRPLFHEGRNDDEHTRRPTDEEFAEAYKALRRKGRGPGDRTLREELAERYGVTVWAIDKRRRKCVDLGLLPKKTKRGRRRDRRRRGPS